MRTFWATFRAGFLFLWSDPTGVILLTFFPILLILILGSALSSVMSVDNALEPVRVANTAELPFDGQPYLVLRPFATLEAAEAALLAGEADVAIESTTDEIAVVRLRGGERNAAVTLVFVDGWRQNMAAAQLALRDGRNPLAGLGGDISVTQTATGGKTMRAMDYYAVSMLVMILLYAGMNGMSLFQQNMAGDFGMRIQAAPAARSSVVAGTLAASTAVSFSQGLVTFLFSALVYGVDWGTRVPLVILTLFVVTVFSQLLCILAILLLKTDAAATGAVELLIGVFTFFSKGYTNSVSFGAAERVFQYLPNALAQTVIFGAVWGGDGSVLVRSLWILIGMTAGLGALTLLVGRRKLA
jgi:hypothetical protein